MADHPGVHLVGSVAMENAESVFRALSGELGPYLKRIPDGETGERSRWISWQREMLLNHPDMEIDPDADLFRFIQWDGVVVREVEQVRFKPGVNPDNVVFETGYAEAASHSYEVFRRLRDEAFVETRI